MHSCPICASKLGESMATSFTAYRKIERFWCDACREFKRASITRDFDREDEGLDYAGPILWDLGALSAGHPFKQAA